MARSFEIDLSQFIADIEDAAEAIADGAKRGMHDALDEWKREATDLAPIDKGTLRRSISVGEIEQNGLNMTAEISANATEKSRSGRRFNYAYYIHEKDAGGKKLRTPGTEKKFLDVALDRNEAKWIRDIESEIKDEIKRKGW
jgi:hypothetical protein